MALVGRIAPDFKAKAVIGQKIVDDFSLCHYRGKHIVFFFYPLDFTFVCPTELHAFQDAIEEFEKRECQVIACSVDSVYSHHAWLATPKKQGGIQGIEYPIVSDISKDIARDWGVLIPGEGITYRGLFLIDKEGIVRHQVVNDLPLGRSVEETLRMIDALQHVEQYGEVCPAGWRTGIPSMKPDKEGVASYFCAQA